MNRTVSTPIGPKNTFGGCYEKTSLFSKEWCWYLICCILVVLGLVFLFGAHDFAWMLKSTYRVIGPDTMFQA